MTDGTGPTCSKQINNKNTQSVVDKAQGKIPVITILTDGTGPTSSKQRNNKNTQSVVDKAQGKIPIWIQGRRSKGKTKVKAYSYS